MSETVERWPRLRTGPRERIPKLVRQLVFDRDGRRCMSCGMSLTIGTAEMDHIIPWSADGSDRSENLRILCHDCNADRSNFRGVLDTWGARRTPVCWGCVSCVSAVDDGYVDEGYIETEEVPPPEMVTAFCGFCGLVSRTYPGGTL